MGRKRQAIIKQSGVVPYRLIEPTTGHFSQVGVATETAPARIEILLITSSSRKRWIVPKGHLEDGMTEAQSAEKEAYEEAGIRGAVELESLTSYRYEKWHRVHEVALHLMLVDQILEHYPEQHDRHRQWVGATEAIAMVKPRSLAKALDQAVTTIRTLVNV